MTYISSKKLPSILFKASATLFCGLSLALIRPQITHAHDINLTVSPSKSRLIVKPLATAWQKVTVKNNGDPVTIKPNVYLFFSADSTGNIQLSDSLLSFDPYSDLKHITIAYPDMAWGKTIKLATGEEKSFVVRYEAGANLEEEKYLFLAFEAENEIPEENAGITPVAVTGTPLLISQTEDTRLLDYQPTVSTFKVSHFIDSFFPAYAKALVTNQGTNYITLSGYWELIPMFGQVKRFPLVDDSILAKGERWVRCETTGNCLIYPDVPLGIYKLRLVLNNQQSINTYKKETVVIFLPVWLLLALGVLIGLTRRTLGPKKAR